MITVLLTLTLGGAPDLNLSPWTGGVRELRFTDEAGAHLVRFEFLPERTRKTAEDGLFRSRALTVVHTVGKKELWRAKDFVEACEFDLEFEFFDDSIRVTDLDDDGEAEISFAYQLGCRSDVSPLSAKLLMYEGRTKYALRGDSRVQVNEKDFLGGEFKVDPAFEKAPASFLRFAKSQWAHLINQDAE